MKISRITKAHWPSVGILGERASDYIGRIADPTMTYTSFISYYEHMVQLGGDYWELWVAVDEGDEVIAFANWFIFCPPSPHLGTAHFEHIYSWNRKKEPVALFLDKFLEFAARHRCYYYTAAIVNEPVLSVFKKACIERGVELHRTDRLYCIGRKK